MGREKLLLSDAKRIERRRAQKRKYKAKIKASKDKHLNVKLRFQNMKACSQWRDKNCAYMKQYNACRRSLRLEEKRLTASLRTSQPTHLNFLGTTLVEVDGKVDEKQLAKVKRATRRLFRV